MLRHAYIFGAAFLTAEALQHHGAVACLLCLWAFTAVFIAAHAMRWSVDGWDNYDEAREEHGARKAAVGVFVMSLLIGISWPLWLSWLVWMKMLSTSSHEQP